MESNTEKYFGDVLSLIDESWAPLFTSRRMKSELEDVSYRLLQRRENDEEIIYPPVENVFRIFKLVPLESVRCVIIGQDPYHDGSATGVAFSGGANHVPPSLKNIWAEILRSYPTKRLGPLKSACLEGWCEQGVFLYNTCLTVKQGCANEHAGIWDGFSYLVLCEIVKQNNKIPWLLWGKKAKTLKQDLETKGASKILECGHPSPLSVAHFKNNGHFLLVDDILKSEGVDLIDWTRTMPLNES